MSEVKLLSEPTNYAIVQLSGRAFPGVVFQGDSLQSLIAELEEAASTDNLDEQRFMMNEIVGDLRAVRAKYEAVLREAGIDLPYNCT